ARAEVVKVATPAVRVPVPRVAVPSLKVTVEVGVPVPEDGMMLAVKVTLEPGATEDALASSSVVVDRTVTESSTEPELLGRLLLSPAEGTATTRPATQI